MNLRYISILMFIAVLASACHKDNTVTLSGDTGVLSFTVPGQMGPATIDNQAHNISVIVNSNRVNRANMSVSFEAAAYAITTVNNAAKNNSITGDFTNPVTLKVAAPNGNVSNWTITIITDMEYYGLGGAVTAEKSLVKSFGWYYDQGNTGTYSSINCGPAVSTMAIKWADSTFNHTVEQARNTFLSSGGWWYTNNIVDYLHLYNINSAYTSLPDNYQTIKKYIDRGYILILCLDNYYMRYNDNPVQHINKYYKVASSGSGHFVIVKGYKQIGNNFYFETYDPWSLGITYALDGQLKGQSRYYLSDDLEQATNVWWDYAIIVAPKGKTVVQSTEGLKLQSEASIPAQKGA